MTAHIHAETMLQYAQDAMETDKPWERWQMYPAIDEHYADRWLDLNAHPVWNPAHKYRRKPRTININGHEMPEPVTEVPAEGTRYYVPDIKYRELYDTFFWRGHAIDEHRFSVGLVHSTREAAIAHTKALLSITRMKEADDE